MNSRCHRGHRGYAVRGFIMIEVLVTLLILLVGLLGLAGMQARMVLVNRDSIQRAQALWLLQDMVGRIQSNRDEVTSYITTADLGVDTEATMPTDCAGLEGYQLDLCQWNLLLQGESETLDDEDDTRVGAMEGARGCIYRLGTTEPVALRVVVVWQGASASADPLGSLAIGSGCGSGAFGDNSYRRAVFVDVIIPKLS